jgi:hypothetical protein
MTGETDVLALGAFIDPAAPTHQVGVAFFAAGSFVALEPIHSGLPGSRK